MAEKKRESLLKVFLTDSELHAARLAAAVVGAKSMSKYCRDLIVDEAQRVTASLNVAAALKVAKRGKQTPHAVKESGQS